MEVFLDFNTGDLEVTRIESGERLTDVLENSFNTADGTINYRARTGVSELPRASEFVLATVTIVPKSPVAKTDIDFHQEGSRETTAIFETGAVLKTIAGLELVRLVEAAVSPTLVTFERGGRKAGLKLSIFGSPTDIGINPSSPSNNSRPTFTWTSPPADSVTGPVLSFEVRLSPDQLSFTDVGNVTTITPVTEISDGPHTFQVRAVGSGDRKDAIGRLDFIIDTVGPSTPSGLKRTTGPENETQSVSWNRSSASGTLTTESAVLGSKVTTGSGVDFYKLEIRLTVGDVFAVSGIVQHEDCGLSTGGCQFVLTTADRLFMVPGNHTFLVHAQDEAGNTSDNATLTFQEGLLDVVQNLQVLDRVGEPDLVNTVNTADPIFQWNPPVELPNSGDAQGGIDTYEVAITGDFALAPGFNIPFTSFTDTSTQST